MVMIFQTLKLYFGKQRVIRIRKRRRRNRDKEKFMKKCIFLNNNKTCCHNGVRFLSNLLIESQKYIKWSDPNSGSDQEIWGEESSSK